MNLRIVVLLFLVSVLQVAPLYSQSTEGRSVSIEGKILVGAKEMVYMDPPGLFLEGRIDTGAALSSVHGTDIKMYSQDDTLWVIFNMNLDGVDHIINKKVQSVVHVLQANSPYGSERPVVNFRIRIGPLVADADFTIADRSRMSTPVLVGRNILSDRALVDVSRLFIQSPDQ